MHAHVLIVDDDPAPREALIYALGQRNKWWHITPAATLDEAKALLDNPPADHGPFDIVLTDLVLGDNTGGGIDVLEHAKRRDPFVMVILFTAQERELDRFEAYRHGAFDCVEKNIIGSTAWKEISVKANAAIDFRRLALSSVEDQKRLSALKRFFDPRLLEVVEQNPGALGVRMRQTTVAFWDIRGYSRLCHALTDQPDVLQGFLFDYYSSTTDTIFRHGGVLDKYLGDVVMAIFCDLSGEGRSSAGPAAAAALRMAQQFPRVVRKWQVQWGGGDVVQLGLSCAIHTGDCLVGNLGTTEREQFTAIGAHVNFAAQLRGLAKAGQTVISDDAAKTLPPSYQLEPLGTLEKIKSLPGRRMPVHRLQGKG
ncbi:MAG: adenylate/guanylate cyclase domain-containing protein [Acidobacteriota bacterium]